jgi:hypothetical protein
VVDRQTGSGHLQSDTNTPRPNLLDAQLRLFSPASGGFRPGGWLGLLRETGVWSVGIEPILRSSTAYTDLQKDSATLVDVKERTERLLSVDKTKFGGLRARILWADPDRVVVPIKYATDHPDESVPSTSHCSVCKPNGGYDSPWVFVETGAWR